MVSQVKKERLVLINVAVRLFHVLVNLVKVRCIAGSCCTVLILGGRGLVPLGIQNFSELHACDDVYPNLILNENSYMACIRTIKNVNLFFRLSSTDLCWGQH